MNCSEINPNLEAFALGALDPFTRAQVETHLQSCAACRQTLASYHQLVGTLPNVLANASPLRPPAALKYKIMQAAQADIQARAIQETFAPHSVPPAPLIRRAAWLSGPRFLVGSFATALVVIVLLVGLSYITTRQMEQARLREQQAVAQANSLLQANQRAFQVISSLNKQDLVLRSPDASSNAVGKVQLDPTKPTVLLTAENLPQPGLGESYFVWTITKGTIQGVGQFTPNESGFGMVVFLTDRDDPVLKEIYVTLQSTTQVLPSGNHVLEWTADPNDSSQEFNSTSVYPHSTIIRSGH